MTDNIEQQLLEAERPEPRREMRERVLGAAMPLVRANDSPLDRVWFSPKWRLTAVLLLFVLVGVEAVSNHLVAPAPLAQYRPPLDPAQAVAMAAIEVGLTPAEAVVLAAQAIARPQPIY